MAGRITAIILLFLGAGLGYFIYASENNPDSNWPFRYGLDLDGGTHLTYRADTSAIVTGASGLASADIEGAMNSLRQTVERRVNLFGVSEPIVHVEEGSIFGNNEDEQRLIVELPGVTDVTEAIAAIGRTPVLEFRLANQSLVALGALNSLSATSTPEEILTAVDSAYISTGLTGAYLERAQLVFDGITGAPTISLKFNSEGRELFGEITGENVGSVLAIFLDGQIISAPVIQQEIRNGEAQITGSFTIDEARQLAEDLNFGALPVPVELVSTQTIGPSLGHATLESGISALVWAFILVFIFLIIWYRLPGLVAVISLVIYIVIMLTLFKFIPVTLTASGIAGLILSLGMAVDANILIFERLKEELAYRSSLRESVIEGFKRAWLPIRDGNLSSIISAVVLFWLSGTSMVKGFALVFGIGVLVSMLTAITISRTFLLVLATDKMPFKYFQPTFGKRGNDEK